MPTYTAYFRTETHWAEREFKATTPQRALKNARKLSEQRWPDLDFQPYDKSREELDEIEVCNSNGEPVARWQSDDLLLRIGALNLLNCARKVVARWEQGDLAEAVRELDAAIAQATGGTP